MLRADENPGTGPTRKEKKREVGQTAVTDLTRPLIFRYLQLKYEDYRLWPM
jgi:hypothetical protein